MENNTYRAEFLYRGFIVNVTAKFHSGRAATYEEPEEHAFFEPITIVADDEDLSKEDDQDVADFFGVESFEDFWSAVEEFLFSCFE